MWKALSVWIVCNTLPKFYWSGAVIFLWQFWGKKKKKKNYHKKYCMSYICPFKTICSPKYAAKNSRKTWQMLVPNCRLLLSGNLHLYVHALMCLSGFAFISACDLDVVIRRLVLRRIISTHPFSSGVPLTLSCWRHVLFSLFLMFGHQAGKADLGLYLRLLPDSRKLTASDRFAGATPTHMM